MGKTKKRNYKRKAKKHTKKSRRMTGIDTITSLTARISDPFPQRKWARMRYTDNLALAAPSTNVSAEYNYSLNGLFDTDFTGTGHQPYGFDTMALLYFNYQVTGVYINLEWYDPDQDGVMVGYQLNGTTTAGATIGAIEERPLTALKSISNSGVQKVIQRVYVNVSQLLGLKYAQYNNDTSQYGALVTANPTQQAYLRLFYCSTKAATVSNIKCKISMTFKTQFWNRVSLTQSS